MARRAVPKRAVHVLVGCGLHDGDKLLEVVDWHIPICEEDQRHSRDEANWLEAPDRVVRQFRVDGRIDGERGTRTDQQRVTIGRSSGYEASTDDRAGTPPVVDH